ncbi:AmmeMemoRadiSam system protein A [Gayadomonas joobiniege]|uniref:AmmeMemoRadiSam system protein A n=1 Tax=Gayadomonas joobiniege TaxID=1234606 RepID=UPI00035C3A72|nr:AmmeMemoRadiSam system protein A [Gayadomonas joobiniege]
MLERLNSFAVEQAIRGIVSDTLNYALDHNGQRIPDYQLTNNTELQNAYACYIWLLNQGTLRGCYGSAVAGYRLDYHLADTAYSAAFKDPRFDAIKVDERAHLSYKVAILSPLKAICVNSEDELVAYLQQHKPGLNIRYGQLQASFLPCQWQFYKNSSDFLAALKEKANWPEHGWTSAMKAFTFTTLEVAGDLAV